MAALFFVSQAALDAWAESGRVELDGSVMTLAGRGSGPRYALEPALHFLTVVGADTDPNALVGKVKREARLREVGGECLGASVVLGDVAYEVEPGFVCDAGERLAAREPGGAAPGEEAARELTRFLLENPS
jgi:hypothetical protein